MIQMSLMIGDPLPLPDGSVAPSRVRSYLLWRDIFQRRIKEYTWIPAVMEQNGYKFGDDALNYHSAHGELYGVDDCGFCNGSKTRNDDWGYYYCLCYFVDRMMEWNRAVKDWGSTWRANSLDQMNMNIKIPMNAPDAKKQLIAAHKAAQEWIDYPLRWMAFSGPTGVGKTHILNSMMNAWNPFAIYVVASEFEDRLRGYLSDSQDDIAKYTNALKFHPILLLDDFGLEYSSPWIQQKLENLLEFRSRKRNWNDSITVIATNLMLRDMPHRYLRDGVSRIGSRVTDVEIIDWYALSGTDYRHHGN